MGNKISLLTCCVILGQPFRQRAIRGRRLLNRWFSTGRGGLNFRNGAASEKLERGASNLTVMDTTRLITMRPGLDICTTDRDISTPRAQYMPFTKAMAA